MIGATTLLHHAASSDEGGQKVSEAGTRPPSASATLAVSVHGPAGVLDLVVPVGASSVDVAREYSQQTGIAGIPLLQTPLGELVDAGRTLVEAGVQTGDVLVAATGLSRSRTTPAVATADADTDHPAVAALVAGLGVGFALLAAWYAARAGDDVVRTVVVAVLVACALVGSLPVGRHARQRAVAAPAFGASAALGALYVPGDHLLPAVVASAGLAAAVVAGTGRAMAEEPDEVSTVWIAAGLTVCGVCSLSPLLGWDARVSWSLLVVLAMLAARFVPSMAVDVPDEALLDLDRLAVTAWSARDTSRKGRRGRIVVAGAAMARLVQSASRTVTAGCAAILVVGAGASPLLLRSADADLDLIGSRCLVFFAGASLLLAARSYRHRAARGMLRATGLLAWTALSVELVSSGFTTHLFVFFCVTVLLGVAALAAAVASGRGWRSVWWSRRAELAESLSGSLAIGSAVVAAGIFRALWEITS